MPCGLPMRPMRLPMRLPFEGVDRPGGVGSDGAGPMV